MYCTIHAILYVGYIVTLLIAYIPLRPGKNIPILSKTFIGLIFIYNGS